MILSPDLEKSTLLDVSDCVAAPQTAQLIPSQPSDETSYNGAADLESLTQRENNERLLVPAPQSSKSTLERVKDKTKLVRNNSTRSIKEMFTLKKPSKKLNNTNLKIAPKQNESDTVVEVDQLLKSSETQSILASDLSTKTKKGKKSKSLKQKEVSQIKKMKYQSVATVENSTSDGEETSSHDFKSSTSDSANSDENTVFESDFMKPTSLQSALSELSAPSPSREDFERLLESDIFDSLRTNLPTDPKLLLLLNAEQFDQAVILLMDQILAQYTGAEASVKEVANMKKLETITDYLKFKELKKMESNAIASNLTGGSGPLFLGPFPNFEQENILKFVLVIGTSLSNSIFCQTDMVFNANYFYLRIVFLISNAIILLVLFRYMKSSLENTILTANSGKENSKVSTIDKSFVKHKVSEFTVEIRLLLIQTVSIISSLLYSTVDSTQGGWCVFTWVLFQLISLSISFKVLFSSSLTSSSDKSSNSKNKEKLATERPYLSHDFYKVFFFINCCVSFYIGIGLLDEIFQGSSAHNVIKTFNVVNSGTATFDLDIFFTWNLIQFQVLSSIMMGCLLELSLGPNQWYIQTKTNCIDPVLHQITEMF
ncbi:hypothetical protein WICPIJ_002403 [Wickerhamomyces pijperi]|uniref:Uncharacterized protein n=1 Tax=Wickerhamomyces pijperi TaxID=599730 RepID=A0A9P8QBX0_WICPI|nr:hypothetical protein WICPIJ_002403 [Wickerhamomyces pijperi]